MKEYHFRKITELEITELENAGIEKGKELFHELRDSCDDSYVTAESKDVFKFDDDTFKIKIIGFWESVNHFEYLIEGKGFSISGRHLI